MNIILYGALLLLSIVVVMSLEEEREFKYDSVKDPGTGKRTKRSAALAFLGGVAAGGIFGPILYNRLYGWGRGGRSRGPKITFYKGWRPSSGGWESQGQGPMQNFGGWESQGQGPMQNFGGFESQGQGSVQNFGGWESQGQRPVENFGGWESQGQGPMQNFGGFESQGQGSVQNFGGWESQGQGPVQNFGGRFEQSDDNGVGEQGKSWEPVVQREPSQQLGNGWPSGGW